MDDLVRAAESAASDTAEDAAAAVSSLGWLSASIEADRAAGAFARWGASTVLDENTGAPVIGRALHAELHRRAGFDAVWPVGNAGLLHCYGYLLSLTPTPYGLKRERWLGSDLPRAYGRDGEAFLPWAGVGSLLARATAAASAALAEPAASVEQDVDGRATRLALSAGSGPAALAYAVAPTAGAAPLLVTTFPVADAAAVLMECTSAPPRLRWNAV
jgi:hypothetical protein